LRGPGPRAVSAATALERGLTVATRNVAQFGPTGVAVVDLFDPTAG
jgi:predicted nucleic acid-binding protein